MTDRAGQPRDAEACVFCDLSVRYSSSFLTRLELIQDEQPSQRENLSNPTPKQKLSFALTLIILQEEQHNRIKLYASHAAVCGLVG